MTAGSFGVIGAEAPFPPAMNRQIIRFWNGREFRSVVGIAVFPWTLASSRDKTGCGTGFTLIELLVVNRRHRDSGRSIAPRFIASELLGQERQCKSNLRQLSLGHHPLHQHAPNVSILFHRWRLSTIYARRLGGRLVQAAGTAGLIYPGDKLLSTRSLGLPNP